MLNQQENRNLNHIYIFTAASPVNYRKRPNNEKATDDYHYEKFKKMNRRYWGHIWASSIVTYFPPFSKMFSPKSFA